MRIKWSLWRNKVREPSSLKPIGDAYARQRAGVVVKTDEAMTKLFDVLANRYKYFLGGDCDGCRDRNGGYTRIMRCGYRDGDKAPMCYIEYIDRSRRVDAGDT